MKKLLSALLTIILWVWQLPQHLIAVALMIIYSGKTSTSFSTKVKWVTARVIGIKDNLFLRKNVREGITLGYYIFLDSGFLDDPQKHDFIVKHESGHSIQSIILGPLYLPVVGVISAIRSEMAYEHNWSPQKYYGGWPESWANSLSGVNPSDIN